MLLIANNIHLFHKPNQPELNNIFEPNGNQSAETYHIYHIGCHPTNLNQSTVI